MVEGCVAVGLKVLIEEVCGGEDGAEDGWRVVIFVEV